MNKPLIVLTGPTAVGKTNLSIKLAKAVNGAIVSADSMQVYRDMNIGTAKISLDEMQGVKHYLIDELEPENDFNVVLFQKLAKKYIDEIYKSGQIPIIVGGTGFYIQAVLRDIDFTESKEDSSFREHLQNIADTKGADVLHDMLKRIDLASAESIHANNVKRVIRAIEYNHQSGQLISQHNEEEKLRKSPYNYAYFVLNDERKKLYEKIDKRIDLMLEQGLVDEVTALKNRGLHSDMVSMKGLGYKEILSYLNGECSLDEAVYILKRDTRHFAKRQLTWFKREEDVIWLNKTDYNYKEEEILEYMLDILKNKNII